MTDKQIIIDGVDVSKCTRYCADNGKCTAFKSQYLCSERDNCYTKRILKKNKKINSLQEQLDQFKTENKHLNDLLNQALKDYEKTRETLTEIKEIAEDESYIGFWDEQISEILQKISEVE